MKKFLHAIFYAAIYCCALLPFWLLYRVADITFPVLYHVIRYRRKTVAANLRESFPEKSERELKQIERKFYRNFADYIFETIKLLHISDKEISKRMTFENLDIIDRYTKAGRSVAVYFSHCGNWEWGTSVTLHSALPINKEVLFAQVYRPLRDKWADGLMLKLRSRFNSLSFTKKNVFRDIIRECRRTGLPAVVGFMSDQRPSHGDLIHVVEFLNHPTAFITGTETLARKLDMGVVYWDMYKPRRGHYHIVTRDITGDIANRSQFSVTDQYAEMLQTTILREPSLWLWSHKRWKKKVTFEDNEQARQ
ncbi:MAG: lysophospholipid acyltransferase family protein [Muribaculaceae bacterium]|nr:lysophospholipid acyltransferase family protein [Muribaculaceae bacterium]